MRKIALLFLTLISSFLVGSTISWSSPVVLSGPVASDPQVVMDPNGNATAAWVDNDSMCVSTQLVGGSWSAPTTLGTLNCSSPQLDVDASGNVTAAWIQSGIVQTSTLPFGGDWSEPVSISGSGANSLALSIDGKGDMAAIWVGDGLIEISTNPAGSQVWGPVSILSSDISTDPDLDIGENGTICAVWHSSAGSSEIIQAATMPSNGTWSSAQTVTPISTFNYGYPCVAVDPNGNPTILFYQYFVTGASYTNVSMCASSLTNGTWSAPTLLLNNAGQRGVINPANLTARIKTDPAGNIMALWSQSYDGSTFAIENAVNAAGGTGWEFGDLLVSTVTSYQADVAMHSLMGAVAAYMALDGNNISIQYNETGASGIHTGAFWAINGEVSASQTNNAYPRIAAVYNNSTSTLYAAAVWINSTAGNICIAAATGSKIPIQPPSGLSVVQGSSDYGIFSEYHNTISWTRSPSPDVNYYAIYRSGVFFATVPGNAFQIVDHNVVQEGAVTYGVGSLDSFLQESTIVSTTYP